MKERVERIIPMLHCITPGQMFWLEKVVPIFASPAVYTRKKDSDFASDDVLERFGDILKIHHAFSVEAFSKDKFEYGLVQILKASGRTAALAPRGNPGHDLTVDCVKISLKTQADKNIDEDTIWISKFMELGKGEWDVELQRGKFLSHLTRYDRIFTLRNLSKAPDWKYELVEIPKALFEQAATGTIEIRENSKQNPKPAYCHVFDSKGVEVYNLYFDGGTERKLHVKALLKSACIVHATWAFSVPPEPKEGCLGL